MSTAIQISKQKRLWILITIMVSTFGLSLPISAMYNLLTWIYSDIGISWASRGWLYCGVLVAICIVMPLSAFLIHRFPTRNLYLTGIVVFLCGLILTMLSSNFPLMLCGVVLIGCGNGLLLSMSQAVILSIYPPEKKGFIMGMFGLAFALAVPIAQLLTNVLAYALRWRVFFAVVLAVMVVALIMAIRVFDNVLETCKKNLGVLSLMQDILSFVLGALAFGGIAMGISHGINGYYLTDPNVYIPLLIGIAAMVAFILRQVNMPEPFLNVKVMKARGYTSAMICTMLMYLIYMGYCALASDYVILVMSCATAVATLASVLGAVAIVIVSPFAGLLYDKIGIRKLAVFGGCCMLVSIILMIALNARSPGFLVIVSYVLQGIAVACMMTPLTTYGVTRVQKNSVADATAITSSFRTILGYIGCAMFPGIMNAVHALSEDWGFSIKIALIVMACVSVIIVLDMVFSMDRKKKAQT